MKEILAFPCDEKTLFQGMTLRDYFAAKAMQGMMTKNGQPNTDYIAVWSYEMADAMLQERKAK